MSVTGTSPDGAIQATVTGENRLDLRFRPGAYEWYDERGLGRELSALGTTTWVAWTRRREEIMRLARGQSHTEAEQSRHRAENPFIERLRLLECEGASPGGTVHIHLTGATRWQVQIADNMIRNIPEQSFVREAVSAFDALIRDRSAKLALLRAEHFDLGLPRTWLDRAGPPGKPS